MEVKYYFDSTSQKFELKPETSGSSGIDLRSNNVHKISPGKVILIKTGLHVKIPEGYEGQIRSRSGLALKKGIMVLNSPGTVDCFTKETKISTELGEKTISELKIDDLVFSVNSELEIEKKRLLAIVNVGEKQIYEIETESGKKLKASENTLILTEDGFKKIKEVKKDYLVLTF